ncbi:MAG: NYN domain-containing protein [Nitrospiria bacterium]
MGLYLIIDGYNFIGSNEGLSVKLQAQRDHLIDRLSSYQKIRKIPVCVVFDAWKEGGLSQNFEMIKGIEVIYSRLGEKADQVIIRMIKRLKEQCIVVSSDREIRDCAEKSGATSLTINEFQSKLIDADQDMDEEEMDKEESEKFTKGPKRGNPNKLSKKERAKRSKLKKL